MDVEHTKALEQKATPGPWWAIVVNRSDDEAEIFAGSGLSSDLLVARDALSADAEFIADARTATPVLVAAVERVRALADDLESRAAAIEEANPTHTAQIALHRQHAAMILEALETP